MKDSDWARFEAVVNNFSAGTANQIITWLHYGRVLDRYYEEPPLDAVETRSIPALVAYNAFKVWPMTDHRVTGDIDQQYAHLYLLKTRMQDLGYLTPNGNLNFNPSLDRFIINGDKFKPAGDTQVSQTSDHPIFIIIILERDTPTTRQKNKP